MSLLEQQNFLARLYTDENLRRAFLSEPEKTGRENGLGEKEIAELSAIVPDELEFFGDSLVWKRLREVEKFLPLVKKALGEDFESLFREFANQFRPTAIKKHHEDAVEFCGFLQKQKLKPAWAKDLAGFEQAKLIFNSGASNFVRRRFDYDLREILAEFSRRDANSEMDFKRRKTHAFWVRIGKTTRFIVF